MTEIIKQLQKPLEAHEIDFRVQSIGKSGWCTMLAYKDARVDMKRLDEVFGVFGWQRDYREIKGNLFCGISILNPENDQWVTKWDVGTESYSEATKGEASDSFKRSGFNYGIGRELYDYPRIFLPLKPNEFTPDGNKGKQTWDLKLRDWMWHSEFFDDNTLKTLSAVDEKNIVRFDWTSGAGSKFIDFKEKQAQPRMNQDELLEQIMQKMDEAGNVGELRTHYEGGVKHFKDDDNVLARLEVKKDQLKLTFAEAK